MARLTIVIVHYHCGPRVAALLRLLSDAAPSTVIVVDNGGSESDLEILTQLEREHPCLKVLRPGSNIGFGAAVNLGVAALRLADEDLVWILNPDLEPEPSAASTLVASLRSGEADIVSPLLLEGDKARPVVSFASGRFNPRLGTTYHDLQGHSVADVTTRLRRSQFLTGAAPMLSGKTWNRLDGFSERYFLYWEDADLSMRAQAKGLRLAVNTDARVWHDSNGSSAESGRSSSYFYYMARNREIFLADWARLPSRRARVPREIETIRLVGRALKQRKDRRLKVLAVLRGRLAGVGQVSRQQSDRGAIRADHESICLLSGRRVIPELRAAHLQELDAHAPRETIYFSLNYDMHGVRIPRHVQKRWLPAACISVARQSDGCLELHEPLWIEHAPSWLALAAANRVGAIFGRRRAPVCFYAIENNSVADVIGRGILPIRLSRTISHFYGQLVSAFTDHCVYGTEGARLTYDALWSKTPPRSEVVLDLPARRKDVSPISDNLGAIFVGALETRKGVPELLWAWERVEQNLPGAVLTIVGDGPLRDEAAAWADRAPSTRQVLGLLSRAEIAALMDLQRTIVAPSVRSGRWREQVSRPIREALAIGLTVVSTDETGLAAFLKREGHHVGGTHDLTQWLPKSIEAALLAPIPRSRVLSSLPIQDGRFRADAVLHRNKELT